MADELEKLRPEVREAIRWLGEDASTFQHAADCVETVRAELLRLASDDCGLHEALCEHDELCEQFTAMRLRAERAEAELAALKARIAEAVIGKPIECDFENMTVTLQVDASFSTNGKPFRLVVEE